MLKCEQLTYRYSNSEKGIESVNFSTETGKIIGLIGENGAGKSTFFKCLLGLLKPTGGCITYDDIKLDYSKKTLVMHRQKVNMVFQDPERQLFHTSVFDDITMGPRNLGLDEKIITERAKRCTEQVGADSFIDTPIQYLSFGQKKRVAIAGILALDCNTLLLDEPETGLDPEMKREMIEIIGELSRDGRSIVVSSHNMDLIYELCDYIYVMHRGKMLASGKTTEIMSNPQIMKQASLDRPIVVRISEKYGFDPKMLQEEL